CSTCSPASQVLNNPFHDQGRQTRNLAPINYPACSSEPTLHCHHPCTHSTQSFTLCKAVLHDLIRRHNDTRKQPGQPSTSHQHNLIYDLGPHLQPVTLEWPCPAFPACHPPPFTASSICSLFALCPLCRCPAASGCYYCGCKGLEASSISTQPPLSKENRPRV
ncbi:hypothetical protein CORC01_03687, partial [Colletotrichum orchidophilum]